jgi:hypothetical protein
MYGERLVKALAFASICSCSLVPEANLGAVGHALPGCYILEMHIPVPDPGVEYELRTGALEAPF